MKRKYRFVCVLLALVLAFGIDLPYYRAKNTVKTVSIRHIKLITLQEDTDSGKIIQDAVKRFQKANKDYDITVEAVTNDRYKSRMSDYAATDQIPDVFMTWTGGTLQDYISAGLVADLSKFMRQGNYRARFLEKSLRMVSWNNGIWAVPVENMTVGLIYYNKSIFHRLHLSPPSTYDQLLKMIPVLRKHGYIPFALANRTAWSGSMFYMYLVDRLGGPSVFAAAAARKNDGSFANPVFVRAGAMIQQLVRLGAFPNTFNYQDEDAGYARELMYKGSTAMSLSGSWFSMYVKCEDSGFEKNLGVFPFPVVPGGRGNKNDLIGSLGDNFYAISSGCRYKDKAFELIRYLIDDTAVQQRVQIGEIPPVKNVKLTDPLVLKCFRYVLKAPNVQFWYDQFLPPRLANRYLTLNRSLFGGADPEKTARAMEASARDYYKR